MENIDKNNQEIIPETYTACTNSGCRKLSVTNWLEDLSLDRNEPEYVEVQFKNTRKAYFINSNKLPLKEGAVVAVEMSPGHDIGHVALVGELVLNQMRKNKIQLDRYEFKRVYRMAKPSDIEKWNSVKEREYPTMIRAREIAKKLNLAMKIGDVEFQGDGNKAIFYYIADRRVDFRQLIKDLASEFAVRIEMRQIGARQEAGLIGGIGPCGRELCCSKWNTNFASVNTSAARIQELSLNPEKLTGMCAKLKCCLNYEVDIYQEALKDFPSKNRKLETAEGSFRHIKNDTLKGLMTYILNKKDGAPVFATISKDRAKEVIRLNEQDVKPDSLVEFVEIKKDISPDYENVVGQDDLTRFDNPAKRNNKKRRPKKRRPTDSVKVDSDQKQNKNQSQIPKTNQKQKAKARPKPKAKPQNSKQDDGVKSVNPKSRNRRNNPRPPKESSN